MGIILSPRSYHGGAKGMEIASGRQLALRVFVVTEFMPRLDPAECAYLRTHATIRLSAANDRVPRPGARRGERQALFELVCAALGVAACEAFDKPVAIEDVSAIVADCRHEFLKICSSGRDNIAAVAAIWAAHRLVDHETRSRRFGHHSPMEWYSNYDCDSVSEGSSDFVALGAMA
jgi:hypothetical protein